MDRNNKYFLAVAGTGNIKKAADQLYVTQPTLTTAIKKLEADLGVPLFARRSKGVELTEYGHVFLKYVEEQYSKEVDLLHKMKDMLQREKGKLKIGVGDVWWENFVRDAVLQYHHLYADSSLYVEFGNNLALMQHLIQGDIDLFIGHEILDLKSRLPVVFKPLLQDKEAIFVRDGHPLLTKKRELKKNKELLNNYPIIRITPDHTRNKMVLNNMLYSEPMEKNPLAFEIDSLFASLDLLKITDAIMPFSDKMTPWMEAQHINLCYINEERIGNVGIYHKRQLDDAKAYFLIEKITESAKKVK